MRGAVAFLSVVLPASLAAAQYQGQDARKVSVTDLTRSSMTYNESPVITTGDLTYGDSTDVNYNIFELRGDDVLRTVRVATAPGSMDDLRFKVGQKVEIQGIFFDLEQVMDPQYHPVLRYFPGAIRQDGMSFDKNLFIAVTSADVIEDVKSDIEAEREAAEDADVADPDIDTSSLSTLDLRELVGDPAPHLGKQVMVLGKFRGSNLYGDLSIKHKRTPRDFVIKVADSAIWVTGRRPRGKGFRLDPSKRRDTGEWLRVIGEPFEDQGTVYLRAAKIEIAEDPNDPDLEPERMAREEKEPGPPPEVTFSIPIAGERDIPLTSEFRVQFSKDMKEESFHRNVDLLYADDDGIGNPFPDLAVTYDGTSRTLIVRPGKELAPGKEIRLILYDAISDEEGQKLPVQDDSAGGEPGAAVILIFTTAKG
jgi:hypothetical protein